MAQPSIGQRFFRPITQFIPYRTRQRLLLFTRDIRSLPERLQPGSRPLPWSFMHDVGGGDFYGVGRIIRDKLIAEAGLQPHHHVLDIGCGTGRVAFALTEYLNAEGLYTGFDVNLDGLIWMMRHLPKTEAGFRIVRADVHNTEYRPDVSAPAAGYRFPASDASVDVVFATSVFTHLRAGDAENYFREIGRCLKPGGTAYVTLFAMTPERWALAEAGKAFIPFERFGDGAYVGSSDVPEATIAFDEPIILGWIAAAGLTVAAPMQAGGWSKSDPSRELQDVLLLRRAGA